MLVQKFANIVLLSLSVNFFIMIVNASPATPVYECKCRQNSTVSRCLSPQCDSIARDMWIWLDATLDPCEDFYKYACGYYPSEVIGVVSNFIDRRTQINREIADFLRRRDMQNEPEALGVARSIFNICVNIDEKVDKMKMLSDIMGVDLHHSRHLSSFREEQCFEIIKSKFDLLFGYLFAKEGKYENATALAVEISEYVDKSFKTIINQSMWMDEGTKIGVLNKLASLKYSIGFPHNIHEELGELLREQYDEIYSQVRTLIEQRSDPFKILDRLQLNVKSYEMNHATDYQKNPSKSLINHILIRHINEIGKYYDEINTLSLGVDGLGFPILTDSLKSVDFGRVGVILAREIAKLFNPSKKSQWWSKKSSEKYDEKVKCFKRAENRFNLTRQGAPKTTINEDLLDYVGFHAALLAYKIYASGREKEPFLVLFDNVPQEQLFILGFAHLFCEYPLSNAYTASDKNHRFSPAAARVNNVLRNSKDFAEIWHCPAGSNMNPVNKCDFW